METQHDKIYAERSVTITRVLKAPRDLVWRAWTDPNMLKEWWGPEHFTNPVVEGDVKVGGMMHITMHGPKARPGTWICRWSSAIGKSCRAKSWCSRMSRSGPMASG